MCNTGFPLSDVNDSSILSVSGVETCPSSSASNKSTVQHSISAREKHSKGDCESKNIKESPHGNKTIKPTITKSPARPAGPNLRTLAQVPHEVLIDPLYVKFQDYKLHSKRIAELKNNKI